MVRKIGRVVRQYEGKPIIYGMPLEELTAWFEAKAKRNSEQVNYGTGFTANV